jgi:hypothetical protein
MCCAYNATNRYCCCIPQYGLKTYTEKITEDERLQCLDLLREGWGVDADGQIVPVPRALPRAVSGHHYVKTQ